MRKILPQAYGGYSEDKIFRITQISGKLAIYGWALDYDFDENANEAICFRKEQFTVDLAFRLADSSCLVLNTETKRQNLRNGARPSARDEAVAYWDVRLENVESCFPSP